MMYYIVIIGLLLIVLVGGSVAIAVVSYHRNRYLTEEYDDVGFCQWYVEFWNVEQGMKFTISFDQQVVLGRGAPGETYEQTVGVDPNETIAREQCLLFAYNGGVLIKNLATINRTVHNGTQIQELACLQIGDRLAFGACIFLVTDIRFSRL